MEIRGIKEFRIMTANRIFMEMMAIVVSGRQRSIEHCCAAVARLAYQAAARTVFFATRFAAVAGDQSLRFAFGKKPSMLFCPAATPYSSRSRKRKVAQQKCQRIIARPTVAFGLGIQSMNFGMVRMKT